MTVLNDDAQRSILKCLYRSSRLRPEFNESSNWCEAEFFDGICWPPMAPGQNLTVNCTSTAQYSSSLTVTKFCGGRLKYSTPPEAEFLLPHTQAYFSCMTNETLQAVIYLKNAELFQTTVNLFYFWGYIGLVCSFILLSVMLLLNWKYKILGNSLTGRINHALLYTLHLCVMSRALVFLDLYYFSGLQITGLYCVTRAFIWRLCYNSLHAWIALKSLSIALRIRHPLEYFENFQNYLTIGFGYSSVLTFFFAVLGTIFSHHFGCLPDLQFFDMTACEFFRLSCLIIALFCLGISAPYFFYDSLSALHGTSAKSMRAKLIILTALIIFVSIPDLISLQLPKMYSISELHKKMFIVKLSTFFIANADLWQGTIVGLAFCFFNSEFVRSFRKLFNRTEIVDDEEPIISEGFEMQPAPLPNALI